MRTGMHPDAAFGPTYRGHPRVPAHECRPGCASAPMSLGVFDVDNRSMSQLAIRCQPPTFVPTREVEQWLEDEVERLRAGSPHASFRLHRITTTETTENIGTGWLIELDSTTGDLLDRELVDAVLRDFRLLGLRPTLLGTLENEDSPTHTGERHANGGGP
jgi:hypothetical protein